MIGRTFSHFRIVEKLGQGGMGEVFLAEDSALHRKVALKFLPAELQRDAAARKRLLREARSAAALDHPFICHINEVGEAEGRDYIVMEHVEGRSLKDRLEERRPAAGEVLSVGIEVAEALEEAHGKGIVHRDIKPGNIMLTRTGHAKVMDFGLARQNLAEAAAADQDTETELTQRGMVVGTLAYMSPEQLRGQIADARSDLWALGVTLYEMAAGIRPFAGQSGFEISSAILNQPPRPLPAEVPAELGAVIGRCLQKDPEKRYQRAAELRASLEAVRAGTVSLREAWRCRLMRSRWRLAAVAWMALLLLAGGLLNFDVGGLRGRISGRTGIPVQVIRIAVLPFANVSGDAEQEYLSDGLTTELISLLGRLHPETLRVIARTTAMSYKKTDKPVDRIGRELGVDYILEGSAQREAGRIRITADLIRVTDQTQLWSDRYERELAGILALQNEVAQMVAAALALKLLPAEQARLAGARPVHPEAYEAYLKGSQQVNQLTPQALDNALEYFELALQKDPNNALAYAGISYLWLCRNQMGYTPPREGGPRAKAAARRAIELDGTLAQGHLSLAHLLWLYEWDWARAEAEYKKVLELNPNFADPVYAQFLLVMGRPQEAEAQIQRALQLDPLSEMVRAHYSFNLVATGRDDQAVVEIRKLLRTAPQNPPAHWILSTVLFRQGKQEEALAEMKACYAGDSEMKEALTQGYAQSGYRGAMRRAADLMAARARQTYQLTSDLAQAYGLAGEEDQVLTWLENGFETRDPNMPYVKLIPEYESVRNTPRFKDILRRLNLPQ